MGFLGLILILLGLLSAFKPETVWTITEGWKSKDAEPSEGYLLFIRASGVLEMIIGLIMLLNW